jgi:hypothetical protein
MNDWSELTDELARYVGTLQASSGESTTAQDRPRYDKHLAVAALLFCALHRRSITEVLKLVKEERRAFGWGYLSEDCGERATAAFDRFAMLVESFDPSR